MLNIQSQYLSAFWLRSSVVSILISLISDIWVISPHDIKKLFNHKFVVVLDISNIMFYKFLSCVHLFFCFSFCDSMMIPSTPSPPFSFFLLLSPIYSKNLLLYSRKLVTSKHAPLVYMSYIA